MSQLPSLTYKLWLSNLLASWALSLSFPPPLLPLNVNYQLSISKLSQFIVEIRFAEWKMSLNKIIQSKLQQIKRFSDFLLTGKPFYVGARWEATGRSKNEAAAKYNEAQLATYKLIPNYDYPTYLHLELYHSILESLGKIEAANQNPYTAIVSLCSRWDPTNHIKARSCEWRLSQNHYQSYYLNFPTLNLTWTH